MRYSRRKLLGTIAKLSLVVTIPIVLGASNCKTPGSYVTTAELRAKAAEYRRRVAEIDHQLDEYLAQQEHYAKVVRDMKDMKARNLVEENGIKKVRDMGAFMEDVKKLNPLATTVGYRSPEFDKLPKDIQTKVDAYEENHLKGAVQTAGVVLSGGNPLAQINTEIGRGSDLVRMFQPKIAELLEERKNVLAELERIEAVIESRSPATDSSYEDEGPGGGGGGGGGEG